jgi:hypothetical protein
MASGIVAVAARVEGYGSLSVLCGGRADGRREPRGRSRVKVPVYRFGWISIGRRCIEGSLSFSCSSLRAS